MRSVSSRELYNLLQARKGWPGGPAPVLVDLQEKASKQIRGAVPASVSPSGELVLKARIDNRVVCLYSNSPEQLEPHPVVEVLRSEDNAKEIIILSDPFDSFLQLYPFLCAKVESRSALKRPYYPSCILPGLLYLGDLEDAVAMPRLCETLNVTHAVTALAELPHSLQQSVSQSGVKHTWCNVRDVEEADIKEHFETAFKVIEKAREAGGAVFVHCSRGVSRSASLCIAYLMRKQGMNPNEARAHVEARRRITLPNVGFVRCLEEFKKELKGDRSGVYVPIKTSRVEDLEFELPPTWAAPPTHKTARLHVTKGGEELEELDVGQESIYVFGRSITCDFPLEHPSASRQHAVIVHHRNGAVYAVDLKSAHTTKLDQTPMRPYEAYLLRDGSVLSFGASSRQYRVQGIPVGAAKAAQRAPADRAGASELISDDEDDRKSKKRKKEHPEHKRWQKHKVRRWTAGAKAHKQMSENERVSMGAGAGSGCMGPGFY